MPKLKNLIVVLILFTSLFSCKADPRQQLNNWDMRRMITYLKDHGLVITAVNEYNNFGYNIVTLTTNGASVNITLIDPDLISSPRFSLEEFNAGKFLFSSDSRHLIYRIQTILHYRNTPESPNVLRINQHLDIDNFFWRGRVVGGALMRTFGGTPTKIFFNLRNKSRSAIKSLNGILVFKDELNNYCDVIEITINENHEIHDIVDSRQVNSQNNFRIEPNQAVIIETKNHQLADLYTGTSESFLRTVLSQQQYYQYQGYVEPFNYVESEDNITAYWITEKIIFEDGTEILIQN